MIRLCLVLLRVALYSAMTIGAKALVKGGAWLWLKLTPWKRLRRWRTRRAMKSWRVEHPDEVLESFHDEPQEVPVLQGKLTYSGVAALGLAWLAERFGVPVAGGEVEAVVAAVLALYGVLAGVYGRYRASKAD
jgi:hypothetical protein